MTTLPQVPFGPHTISRLIIGGNPFRGVSHQSSALNDEMETFYTRDQMIATLREGERQGVTAMLSRGDDVIMEMVAEYKRQGGSLQWIVQTAVEMKLQAENSRRNAALGPIAIFTHGGDTDEHFHAGKMDEILDHVKLIKDLGLMAGVGAHQPQVLRWVEEQGWPVDFYMTCLYNLTAQGHRSQFAGGALDEEKGYFEEDRERMCEFIRSTEKPCLAYKILAGGRKCADHEALTEAFRWAFDHIKPTDAVVVGIFDKYSNQVAEDAAIVREVLGGEAVDGSGQ